jgi:hypothetical protein
MRRSLVGCFCSVLPHGCTFCCKCLGVVWWIRADRDSGAVPADHSGTRMASYLEGLHGYPV